jgi:signal transduction histidine kinase
VKDQTKEDLYIRELETLLKFSALINSSLNIEDVLESAMKWAEEFTNAEASSVYELDEENNRIFVRQARGEKKGAITGISLRVGQGIAGWTVKTGEAMVVQDVSKERRFCDIFDRMTGFKTRSMISVPMILKDRVIGAVQVINKKNREPFIHADLQILTSMAQHIAIAIENARLYHRLEETFQHTAKELKTAQEKQIRSERLAAMGHLVQGVAHEIRNPVMTIGGFARRLKKQVSGDSRLQKYLDIILDESLRLENLVSQVQRLAEVQWASLAPDHITIVVDEVLRRFRSRALSQGVTLWTEIDRNVPVIQLDADQLITALSNVIENALESMPKGGKLTLKLARENNSIVIVVEDTGSGIAPEQLDAIYNPFVTSKSRGAGLGLTMVHQIIMNHHGEIKIGSKPQKGTVAVIRLPVGSGQKQDNLKGIKVTPPDGSL